MIIEKEIENLIAFEFKQNKPKCLDYIWYCEFVLTKAIRLSKLITEKIKAGEGKWNIARNP